MPGGDQGIARSHRRTRTGCLKCRVRRRKCDEGKPVCRNCKKKNFECVYGTQLSFLSKNAYTVSEPSGPPAGSNSGYGALQFVDEDLSKNQFDSITAQKETRIPSAKASHENGHDRETLEDGGDDSTVDGFAAAVNPRSQREEGANVGLLDAETLPTGHQPVDSLQTSNDTVLDGCYDESAVHGLLALGHSFRDTARSSIESPSIRNVNRSILSSISKSMTKHPRFTTSSPILLSLNSTSNDHSAISVSEQHSAETEVSAEHMLELLKHYRYEVAPWLDAYDMSQSFGILVPRLAMESREVLYALLALSANSLKSASPSHSPSQIESEKYIRLSESCRNRGAAYKGLHGLLAAILRIVYYFVSGTYEAWMRKFDANIDAISDLSAHGCGSDLLASMYGCLLRIDLSAALVNNTSVRIPLPPSHSPPIFDWETKFGTIFRHGQYVLLLCAQAVGIQSGDPQISLPLGSSHPHSLVESWKVLVERLGEWYRNRPQEFQPMLELPAALQTDGPEDCFPVVLFTNSAAVFANQLYHTAMLRLLQNRPRTLRFVDHQSVFMSPLWHAYRICGIALNNDRREWWDLSLLASLLVVARIVTHESQQRAIEQGLVRIQALTGWDINGWLTTLRDNWRLAEEV